MAVDKRDVLRRIEGDYLLDYAIFTGVARVYVTRTLEECFIKEKNDLHRRMFLLAVYRDEYSAYEDLGALLMALLTHRQNPEVPLLETLISYGVGQVELSKVMERFAIKSSEQLYEQLGLGDLIPATWREQFPGLDLEKALRTATDFFFVDCLRNQKKDGLRAFNKLKHGVLVVPNAKRYLPNQIDAPAALYKTDESNPEAVDNPVSLYAVPMTDVDLEGRLLSIHCIQANLRMIAALQVIARHPETLQRRGFKNPSDVLRAPELADVLDFIKQVTERGKRFSSVRRVMLQIRRCLELAVQKVVAFSRHMPQAPLGTGEQAVGVDGAGRVSCGCHGSSTGRQESSPCIRYSTAAERTNSIARGKSQIVSGCLKTCLHRADSWEPTGDSGDGSGGDGSSRGSRRTNWRAAYRKIQYETPLKALHTSSSRSIIWGSSSSAAIRRLCIGA